MKTLGQLGLIFGFGLAGEMMARLAPIGIPASVWGLSLLLAALRLGILKTDSIDSAGSFLAANMAFFFLPSTVNILESQALLKPVWFRLLLVCVLSTGITFLVTYHTVRLVRKITQRGK